MRRGAGRAFVGFMLTVLLTVVLAGTCFAVSLKTTVFRGDSLKDLIKNMNLGSVMEEVMFESTNENNDEDNALANSSSKFTETIMTEDVINDVTDVIVEALTDGTEVDFSVVKDGCMAALTDMSEQAVDDVLEEIKNTSNVVDAESLKNNSVIKQYQEEFNIDVTTPILEHMQVVYGSKSVSLDSVDVEEVKAEAKDAVHEKVMPDIEKKVDQFIEETNVEVNKEIHAFRVDNDIKSVTDIFNPIFDVILKSIIIGAVVAVIIIALQFVVYRKDMNKALKNVGISSALVAVVMVATNILCNVLCDLFTTMFESGSAVDNAVVSVIENTIPSIGGAAKIIAIVAGIAFVVLIVAAIIVKKKINSKDELHTTKDTFVSPAPNNAYAFNTVADQSSTNNMYGQQPMANNMYGQQPMANNMYAQQPMVNDMYTQQPMANETYTNQVPADEGTDNSQM